MNTTIVLAASLALSAVALSTGAAQAQRPCAVNRSVSDSARAEVAGVLFSDRPIMAELRREQGIPQSAAQVEVSLVRDASVCERLASRLEHALAPGANVVVLRVGPIFYARDPDQHLATGIFADTTFRVLMRLGAAVK